MRYWVYINDKVDGPYDEDKLVTLQGFTPDTLICSEEVASSGGQEWVKASSIFEFDEVPANEETAPTQAQQPSAQAQPDAQTQALIAKLEALTSGMSNLQAKLDSMQQHLDNALEQNKKLSDQVASLSHPTQEAAPTISTDEPHSNTITLTRHDMNSAEEEKEAPQEEEPAFPQQAAPEEEEVIIRSALDSLYGGKPVELEDTFQDLIPEKTAEQQARKAAEEEQAVHNIEPELEFIPVQEENKEEPSPKPEPAPVAAMQPTQEDKAEPLPADALDEIEKEMTFLSLGEQQEAQPAPQPVQAEPAPEQTPAVEAPAAQEPAEQAPAVEEPASEEPVAEESAAQEPAAESSELKEAVITTPGVEETTKDALINELTASPKEDILDQIIAQHQQEQETAPQEEESHTAQVALGAAAAGLAAASLVSLVDNEQDPQPMAIATDKDHPDQLEEVLPSAQMPADVPAQPQPEMMPADLPSVEQTPSEERPVEEVAQPQTSQLPVTDMPQELPQPTSEENAPADLPSVEELVPLAENTAEESSWQEQDIEELAQPQPAEVESVDITEETAEKEVPAAQELVSEEVPPAPQEEELAAPKEEPAPQEEEPAAPEELAAEEVPAADAPKEAAQSMGAITDKDLQDAFGSDDTETVTAPADNPSNEPLPEGNPNELTEIELKEGSTYLISDFVPPAQLTDNVADVMEGQNQEEERQDKKQETIFQDMLAAVTKSQSFKALDTDGLPDDLAATQVNLENTIQAKRGASLDIKTVPMVPEPQNTQRLDVDELNDVNAQHDLKTNKGLSKSTKTVMMLLVGLLLLIILYVVLGMMKLLPASVNLFTGKQAPAAQTAQEILAEPQLPVVQEPPAPTAAQQAQEKVQNFPLPNAMTLKAFIESKHATIAPELITWETAEAVEADNYAITVKVPPENPQNFKTVYRFNYNMVSGLLDPTVSDAKNLLDQAYGVQPAAQPQTTAAPAAKKTAPAKTGTRSTAATRKGTATRKRTN